MRKSNTPVRKTEIIAETTVNNGHNRADIMRMGDIEDGTPVQVLKINDGTTLERWRKRGRLTDAQYLAGCDYTHDFYRAHIGANYARQRLDRIQTSASDEDHVASAREKFRNVCKSLGPLEGDVLWHVVGEGLSLREYEQRCHTKTWTTNRHIAAGLMIAGLDRLARHYGHE
jgi:hypothetical protein